MRVVRLIFAATIASATCTASALAEAPKKAPSDQSAPVTDCDRLAAEPTDPERRAPGVEFDKIDTAKALPVCKSAVAAHPKEKRFRYQLARTLNAARQFDQALTLETGLAGSGYIAALLDLGSWYDNGIGVRQDKAKAVAFYRKAADLGSAEAIFNLGHMYSTGDGVPQDEAKAVRLYRKAAALGYPDAIGNLGVLYSTGQGVAQDKSEAARLYRKAADLGHAHSMKNLAIMYATGVGVAQDKAEAVRLYRKAADLGDTDAIYNLGVMYEDGDGVAKDKAEAARLYRKGADLGSADSMYALGSLYENGEGVEQSHASAAGWIFAAIENQHDFTLQQAPFAEWSQPFRKELQMLLSNKGAYTGALDGKASEALTEAVQKRAAKAGSGG